MARAEADLAADGSTVLPHLLDVAGRAAFQAVVDEVISQWGRLDILVHNAIYMPLIRFDDMSPETWQRQIDVSLGGLYNGTHAVWEQMKAQGGGHIMGIASGSSVRGYKDEVAYCTAKHAQKGFDFEFAPEKVTLYVDDFVARLKWQANYPE